MSNQFYDFVASELLELETRDCDRLFDCIRDSLMEMGYVFTESLDAELYVTIENQLETDHE